MSAIALGRGPHPRYSVVRVGPRAALVLAVASLAGLAMFCWPLVVDPASALSRTTLAPLVFAGLLPLLVAVVLAELTEGGLDAKALALLGVLSAVGAALRPLGAGTAGIETVFFLLVLAGRVFGPGFGFVLGCTTLFASALLTGGVGPWLPFQMLAAAWVGLLSGCLPLPRLRGRGEVAMLAFYGAASAYLYGALMNLAFWPFTLGAATQLSYVPGAAVAENLHRFLVYTVSTSAAGWDTGRALTNLVAIALVGPAVLGALRRAATRAAFSSPVEFVTSAARGTSDGDAG